ncbi:spore germination protein [Heyndrickxia ginsengihumi]|uniref:spore germination protein n=1 Tax=Heyndrickxia ginsengihumi TaxID=363870 RepID=UPI003D1A41C9
MPFWWKRSAKKKADRQNTTEDTQKIDIGTNLPHEKMSTDLKKNIDHIKKITGNSSDIVIHELTLGKKTNISAVIVYIDGLVDSPVINISLLKNIMDEKEIDDCWTNKHTFLNELQKRTINIGSVNIIYNWDDLFHQLASGDTILLVDHVFGALNISTRGGDKRSIEEPATEVTVRGPRDGFTESLRTNTTLIRRRIKSPNLWVESMKIGTVTQTDIALMYINGIANEEIIDEARKRLKGIRIDSILESGYIEQLIEDRTFTTFPTLYHTERPDVVAANLLEGRFAIVVDGTPFVLTAPALFIEFFQSAEDYYSRFDIATAIRFLRVLVFTISLIGPAVYIAATTFHQEMLPTSLIFTLTVQRELVPFPAFVEAVMMEICFEILREAGLRLPRPIGQTVSIVGALVIGQAAVQAGIVSPAMVIVVSITAIASFATPSFAIAISARLIRFLYMMLAAIFGFYGIIMGLIVMILHLCSLRSFGVNYMSPFAPFRKTNLNDSVIRSPLWKLQKRPQDISKNNVVRQANDQRPLPPIGKHQFHKGKGDQNEN